MSILKTKINVKIRRKEHLRNTKNGEIWKSVVAAHVQKELHTVEYKPILLKQASNKEELYKHCSAKKKKNHINPTSRLFTKNFILNAVAGRSAPTEN